MKIEKSGVFGSESCVIAAVLATCTAFVASAADFVWQGTANDSLSLDSPSSYRVDGSPATRLPAAGDCITLDVDRYMEVDDASINLLNGVDYVLLRNRAHIVFNVTTNARVSVPVSSHDVVDGTPRVYGLIEKNHDSELCLDAISATHVYGTSKWHYDYFSDGIKVNAGTLKINNTDDMSYDGKVFQLGIIDVAENATVFLPKPGDCYVKGLEGAGLVTNDCDAGSQLRITGGPATFEGVLASREKLTAITIVGKQRFTGVNSTIQNGKLCIDSPASGDEGYAGIALFGEKMDTSPSSVGVGGIQFIGTKGASRLEYIGTGGERTEKTIYFYGSYPTTNKIDAGAYGGLNFAGVWYGGGALASFGGVNVILTGSNTTAMTLSNAIRDSQLNKGDHEWHGQTRPLSITKRGSGRWDMGGVEREFSGIVAVEDGTLGFKTLYDRGTACSLGTAKSCYESSTRFEPFWGQDLATANPVGYALRLGTPGDLAKTGTLEYVGSEKLECSTRPIAVTGRGRFLSSDGDIDFSGVSPCMDGENTLILDGDGGFDVLRDVTNNVGSLSIVKKGQGTWTLLGDQTFGGDLSVEEGTLKIGASYTWFRINFHHNYTNSSGWVNGYWKHVKVREFGFFDESGNRCDVGLEYIAGTKVGAAQSDIHLDPGETDYSQGPGALHVGNSYAKHDPGKLFDGKSDEYFFVAGNSDMTNGEDSKQWIRIALRLADGVSEVKSFDLLPYDYSERSGVYAPCAWSVEGSENGQRWTTLFSTNGLTSADYVNNKWFSDRSDFNASGIHTGIRFDTPTEGANIAPEVRSVRVKPGAVLSVAGGASVIADRLVVDVAGMGTVKGVSLASSGTVDLVGDFAGNACTIPADLKELEGYGNLASGWKFTHNGGSLRRYSARFTAEGILVTKNGLTVIVR